jgi:mRNA interferase HigB
MRIITRRRLEDATTRYPNARSKIEHWLMAVEAANWKNFAHVRATFRHADLVRVKSGKTVVVFNLGDAFRLITAIHHNRELIFILRILTHAEYDKGGWKDVL